MTENFMEENFFRAISELFHSNPVVFLSQTTFQVPRKHLPNPPGQVHHEKSVTEKQEGVRDGIGFAVGFW